MTPGEKCTICEDTMDAACDLYKGKFCDLREQYLTTPMTSDQAWEKLTDLADPSMVDPITREVGRRQAQRRANPAPNP